MRATRVCKCQACGHSETVRIGGIECPACGAPDFTDLPPTPEGIQVYRYALRNDEPGEGWGIFLLDSNGMLAVASDFGNYTYHWPPQGWGPGDFRAFLIQLDDSYLIGKLGGGEREYRGDQTVQQVKEYIIQCRKEGDLDRERAREEWNLLKDLGDLYDEENFRCGYRW